MSDAMRPEDFGPLCDALLLSITWPRGGRDLSLDFVLGDGIEKRFTFTWANRIQIAIDQPKGVAPPLTWEGRAERTDDGRLSVLIDFASQGRISLECESIIANRGRA